MPVLSLYLDSPAEFPTATTIELHSTTVEKIECHEPMAVNVWISLEGLTELKKQIDVTLERYTHLRKT